jgi:two-component system phosphate regulon sensor histidine kinase PhoR
MQNRLRLYLKPGLLFAAAGMAASAVLALSLGSSGVWFALAAATVALIAALYLPEPDGQGSRVGSRATLALDLLPGFAREVFEGLPDPLMLVDGTGRVLFANKAMRAVAGTDAERKHVSSVLRTPAVLQAIARTAATGESSSVEFAFHVPVERHYQAYVTRTEGPRLTALLLHDLTSLKRAEQARADFIANASHELRTPLAAVSGFIDTLRGHARDDVAARGRFLDIMSVEAQRMRRLIDDLLSLTRIELNEHVPPAGEVDLGVVVRDAAATLGPLAEADEVSIEISEPPSLPTVIGERDELIQVFQNLIHNAIKYGKPGGHVWIALSPEPNPPPTYGRGSPGAVVKAVVRDDGEGIPREAVPRLTERFYRVDVKRSRERGGTGLGLAIVKHIVNRHQGKMYIDSGLGEGSTITVLLPAAPATAEETAPAVVTEVI